MERYKIRGKVEWKGIRLEGRYKIRGKVGWEST